MQSEEVLDEIPSHIDIGCKDVSMIAGLITNYRMSEGAHKTRKDFEMWFITEGKMPLPLIYHTIANWVWDNDLIDPFEAVKKYYLTCVKQSQEYAEKFNGTPLQFGKPFDHNLIPKKPEGKNVDKEVHL